MLPQLSMLLSLSAIFQCYYYILSNSQELTAIESNSSTIVTDYSIGDYVTTDLSLSYPSRSKICGQSVSNYRIVNGEKFKEHSQPWAVGLITRNHSYFYCGGTLISSKHVLTATHCARKFRNLNDIIAVLGGHNFCDWQHKVNVRRHRVKRIQEHDNFDSITLTNDIAILELTNSVTFTTNIRPIALPLTNGNFVNTEALVIGWGTIKENGSLSCDLLQLKTPIVSNPYCKNLHSKTGSQYLVTDKQICTLYDGEIAKGACYGDSGGPLIYQHGDTHVQIGIVSWGIRCAKQGYPVVHTRISEYMDWIDSIIGSYKPCDSVSI